MGRKNYSNFYRSNANRVEEPKAPEEPKVEDEVVTEPVKEEEPAPKPVTAREIVARIVPAKGRVVNCERVNVRMQPSSTAPIGSIILAGEEVDVYTSKSTEAYYAVKTNHGIEGFIAKDFLEVV